MDYPGRAGPAGQGWTPLLLAAGACWLASAVCITVMAFQGATVAWVIAWLASAAAAVAVTRMADIYVPHRSSIGVTDASGLDYSCRQLMARARLAIWAIADCEVCRTELLGQAVAETALRCHEQEVAFALRELTTLRAEFLANLAGAARGPATSAVLDSHRRALAIAHKSANSRVRALERWAAEVRAADAAWLDWQSSVRLAELNDRYLDLVARTEADAQAVTEITALTEQASALAEALRESPHDTTLAAQPLVLPARDD